MSYRRPPHVKTEAVGHELLLVDLDGGATFRLNGSGRTIFELAASGSSIEEILGRARSTLGPAPRLEKDVRELLADLVESGLLERAP